MKLKNYILLLIFIPIKVSSQGSYDTLTKVNDTSSLNLRSKEKGFELIKVNMIPCSGDEIPSNQLSRVSSVQFSNDKLIISLNFVTDCCKSFLGEIEIKNDSILNLIAYTPPGDICLCYCCYNLDYVINTKSNPFKFFEINGESVKISSIVLYAPTKIYEEYFYKNGEYKKLIEKLDQKIQWIQYYNRKGILTKKEYYDENGMKSKTEYYKEGKVIE